MRITKEHLARVVADADDAFWSVITKAFPEAKHGDLSPEASARLALSQARAVVEWIENNVPEAKLC